MTSYLREVLPKMFTGRLARSGFISPGLPLNLTFSVTNVCQSRCRTCAIWSLYDRAPEKRLQELTLEEIEKIFYSMGHVYVFNISGGEPFLRKDLAQIIKFACRYLTPGIIHIPTNAIAEELVVARVLKILEWLQDSHPQTQLTVKPSLDHLGEKHDEIRGVRGNFQKVMRVFRNLQTLQPQFPNFHVELGTVVSKWNVADIEEIAAFVSTLGIDSYRNEIAEQRSEMFNCSSSITPSAAAYEQAVARFVQQIRTHMKNRLFFHRLTSAFRLVYYDLAIRILREKRQVIPCYAGISNAHLSPYGDLWACCTLGYEHSMGNLRDFSYDFRRLWQSADAAAVRKDIRNKTCSCPLANQTYSNILLHLPSLFKVLKEVLRG